MTRYEWAVWDRVFAATMFELSPKYSSGLQTLKQTLATTVGTDNWAEAIEAGEWPTVEQRLIVCGRVADMAIEERRKRR